METNFLVVVLAVNRMGFLSWANGSSTQPTQQQPPQVVYDRPWQGYAQHSPAYEQAAGGVTHKRYIPGAGWVTMGRPGEGKPPNMSFVPPGGSVSLPANFGGLQ